MDSASSFLCAKAAKCHGLQYKETRLHVPVSGYATGRKYPPTWTIFSDSFGPATGMSGYGNKNPPWGRNPGGMGGMGPPHLGMFEQNVGGGGMLQQGIPLQQQGMGLAGMAPQGMAPVQGQVTGISYPAPRGVAPGGFLPNILQQQQAAMSVMGNVQTSQQVLELNYDLI